MGYTSSKLQWAIEFLQQQGHAVHGNGQPLVGGEDMTFLLDGRRVGLAELYQTAKVADEIFQCQVGEKTCEIHYYFVPGGAEYEVHLDGKKINERHSTDEHMFVCAERVCSSMGGTDLKRLT